MVGATVVVAVTGLLATPTAQDADSTELAAYRLTLPNLTKVINVNREVLKALGQDPNVREAIKIDDELAALSNKAEPSESDQKRIAALEARKEALESSMDNPLGGDARNLSEMEARIRRYPPMAQALRREDMTPREYATFWLTFLQAAFAHGFQKSGLLKQLPPGVQPDNVKFIADHEAVIQAMQKEFEAFGLRR